MKALLSGDTEARVLAARELNNLKTKKKHKLIERGIIVPLVSMLCTQDYDAVEASLTALLNMAFGSERSVSLLGVHSTLYIYYVYFLAIYGGWFYTLKYLQFDYMCALEVEVLCYVLSC